VRHIVKTMAPASLVEWIAENKGESNIDYENIPTCVKTELRKKLLDEQFCLCAYTELRIERDNPRTGQARCHIEHMLPQTVCRQSRLIEKTVNYTNIVACYPADGAEDPGFGARFKDQWPSLVEEHMFLKPTDPSCESRIEYKKDGTIQAASPSDAAANETISRLGLKNEKLTRMRREAVLELFQDARGTKPTRQGLQARHRALLTPIDGKLEQFYSAKRQCLAKKIQSWQ